LRMGVERPKQFLPIEGKPVLMRTIEAFVGVYADMHIILVLPKAHFDYWKELCEAYGFKQPATLVEGGDTRFHSVKNGLRMVPDDENCIVGVHDGVRPFVTADVIKRCFETAREKKAVVPALRSVESVRLGNETENEQISRDNCWLIQTPQTFRADVLHRAYRTEYQAPFTDDASVVEHLGYPIHIVEGCRENIKLTTPFDLQLAEVILKSTNGR